MQCIWSHSSIVFLSGLGERDALFSAGLPSRSGDFFGDPDLRGDALLGEAERLRGDGERLRGDGERRRGDGERRLGDGERRRGDGERLGERYLRGDRERLLLGLR